MERDDFALRLSFSEKVMFVCTGNICRSALAEFLLNNNEQAKTLGISANSSGVGAMVGHSADPAVRTLLERENIDGHTHIAQQINKTLVDRADIIQSWSSIIAKQYYRNSQKLDQKYLLRHKEQAGIIDPYKKDFSVFEQIDKEIKQGINEWVATLSAL